MPATDGTWRTRSGITDIPRWSNRTANASIGVALAIAGFLIVRRIRGDITSPLPPSALVATATVITAWAVCVRFAPRRQGTTRILLLALAMALFAVACSYAGSRAIDWLTWGLAAIVFATSPKLVDAVHRYLPLRAAKNRTVQAETDQQLQQLLRYRHADGSESIHGKLLAEFAPGERTATLYVAFCPPFERLPEVELEISDDSFANAKLAQVLHNGAQIDVRLPNAPDVNLCVAVELLAIAPPPLAVRP
jgi:hypothetical protein